MFEPVSALAICSTIGFAGVGNYSRSSSAISSDAFELRKAATAVTCAYEASQALFGPKEEAISKLLALVSECSERGWDGEDGCPISSSAVLAAESFIRALPDTMPLPELAADPDGAVSLDWITAPNRIFTVSTGSSGRLAFAWIDGADRGHAVARFDGERIPLKVLQGIKSIVTNGDLTVRA